MSTVASILSADLDRVKVIPGCVSLTSSLDHLHSLHLRHYLRVQMAVQALSTTALDPKRARKGDIAFARRSRTGSLLRGRMYMCIYYALYYYIYYILCYYVYYI